MPIFVTGLPRSRTSWWSVLITMSGVPCYHDLLAKVNNVEDFYEKLGTSTGDCDSGLFWLYPILKAKYPTARWVMVLRDVEDCISSFKKAARGTSWEVIADDFEKSRGKWLVQYFENLKQMAVDNNVFLIEYKNMDNVDYVKTAYQHLTGFSLDIEIFQRLNELRIEPFPSKNPFVLNTELTNSLLKTMNQKQEGK